MGTRRENVILDLTDNMSPGLLKAAAAAQVLKKSLNDLSGSGVRSSRIDRDMDRVGVSASKAARGIDDVGKSADRANRPVVRMTGHMKMLADVVAILGPAFVPIGAMAVPAVSGLANQLGVAAIAGGAAVLAFQGVGEALKTVNDAALDPTSENLDAAREAMDKLVPAAQRFVAQIQEMRPAFAGLRDAAADGMFPGIVEGLDALEARLPDVERIISNVSTSLGTMMGGAGNSLASGRWDSFFNYLETDAAQTLTSLGRTIGNLTHGLGEMWVAFDPVNDDFNRWLENVSQSFSEWSSNLDTNTAFQDFMSYLRETGPEVASSMRALGAAFRDVMEAASPLGGPTLKAIEGFSKAVSAIAESDMGTPLLAAASAMALFNRAAAMGSGIMGSKFGKSWIAPITGTTAALGGMAKAQQQATAGTAAFVGAQDKATASTKSRMVAAGKAAGLVAGFGVVASGAAGKIDMANTASLALMGTFMAPGVGTAIGAVAGGILDVASANDDVMDSMRNAQAQFKSANTFSEMEAQIKSARSAFTEFDDEMNSSSLNPIHGYAKLKNRIEGAFGKSDVQEAREPLREMEAAYHDLQGASRGLAIAMGADTRQWSTDLSAATFGVLGKIEGVGVSMEDMEGAAQAAAPAMANLGISMEKLAGASEADQQTMFGQIVDEIARMDSAKGKLDGLVSSLTGLDQSFLGVGASAAEFSSSLGEILAPKFNLSAATDQWHASLNSLDGALSDTSKSLKGNSDAALMNRSAIRDAAGNLKTMLDMQAEAGAGSRKLTRSLLDGVDSIVATGKAAGLSAGEVRAYLTELGFTPAMISTLMTVETGQAMADLGAAGAALGRVDGWVSDAKIQVTSNAPQIGGAAIGVLNRVGGINPTPKIAVGSNAPAVGGAALGILQKVAGTNPTPKINVSSNAAAVAGAAIGAINSVQSRTVFINVVRRMSGGIGVGGEGIGADGMTVPQGFAVGGTIGNPFPNLRGTVPGQRAPYGDKVHAFLAPGEEVISNRNGQADRHRSLLKAINAGRFADGGTPGFEDGILGRRRSSSTRNTLDTGVVLTFTQRLKRSVRELEREIEARKKNRDVLKQQNDAVKDAIGGKLSEGRWDDVDPWATNSPLSARNNLLRAEIIKGQALNADIKKLDKILGRKSVDELLRNASLDEIDAFANSSRKELLEYQRLLNRANNVSNRAQRSGSDATWGPALKVQNRILQNQNKELRAINKKLDRANKQRGQGNKDRKNQPRMITGVLNGTAAQAGKKRR